MIRPILFLALLIAAWSIEAHTYIEIELYPGKTIRYQLVCGEKFEQGDRIVPIKECWRLAKVGTESVVAFEVERVWRK